MAYIDFNFVKGKMNEEDYKTLSRDDDANVTEAIKTADSLIDSEIAAKYSTPLTGANITDAIKEASFVITRKVLSGGIQYDNIPEFVLEDYKLTLAWLKRIGSGTAQIPGVAAEKKKMVVLNGGQEPVMKRNVM
jgi:phage gp36-like protein